MFELALEVELFTLQLNTPALSLSFQLLLTIGKLLALRLPLSQKKEEGRRTPQKSVPIKYMT